MIGAQIQMADSHSVTWRSIPPATSGSPPRGLLGTLPLDEERVPVGVVVEATLDIPPLLELRAGLRVVDADDKIIDPLFDGTVHLIVSGIRITEANP